MNWLLNVVVMVQILAALTMIGLVLVQHGKGADMGASFGSGASGSLFGATGSANFLSRSTAACAAVFFACTLSLAYLSNERARAVGQRARPSERRRSSGQRGGLGCRADSRCACADGTCRCACASRVGIGRRSDSDQVTQGRQRLLAGAASVLLQRSESAEARAL